MATPGTMFLGGGSGGQKQPKGDEARRVYTELVRNTPVFRGRDRTAVSVDAGAERCSPRYHE